VLRPPRVVALALAAHATSLADELPSAAAAQVASRHGAQIFASSCALHGESASYIRVEPAAAADRNAEQSLFGRLTLSQTVVGGDPIAGASGPPLSRGTTLGTT
jgi:hypothetical protein